MTWDESVKIIEQVKRRIAQEPENPVLYEDFLDAIRIAGDIDKKRSYEFLPALRARVDWALRFVSLDPISMQRIHGVYKKSFLYAAVDDFDSYCLYLEWNRDPKKRFYQPRRKTLKIVADDLQDLADRKIQFLGVSLPPRVGKSTLCIFFMTWLMGKYPDSANLMVGHSSILTEGFYDEVMNIITDHETYLWHEVFPHVIIVDKSAKLSTVDLNHKSRFPSLTCRSISGTLTGAVEVSEDGCLYSDDLIEDREESLNPKRLEAKYQAYLNQTKDRKKQGCIELMVGTRWNVFDPLGRIAEQYAGNPLYRFRVIPALDENDHSNFVYDHNLGFDDQYYHDMRASLDDADWMAKYQGNPYIREGLLFPISSLKRYNGVLPEGKPDVVVACCDVAWGGGDYLSMPFAYVYGQSVYIHDWIYNNGSKDVTYPEVVGRSASHRPNRERYEANNGGHEYADKVDMMLRQRGIRCNIVSIAAGSKTSKLGRIHQYNTEIKGFYFLDDAHASAEYKKALRDLSLFVMTGQNDHDDSPDSLAMLADEIYNGAGYCEIIKRPDIA